MTIAFVLEQKTMNKIKANKQRMIALCLLASALCGCDETVDVTERTQYQSASDRYRGSESSDQLNDQSEVAEQPRPLASSSDMAATAAASSTSPTADSHSTAAPRIDADPLAEEQITDLDADSAYRHRYARAELNRLVRAYKRARTEVAQSDMSYKVDHMMTIFKGFELLLHDTPQTFNPLPERDRYAFKNLQESAEDLVPVLEDYLDEFSPEDSQDLEDLNTLLDEARQVIQMPPPGTGNRMLDFIQELETNLENQQRQQP